jgi:hypothetical protein
MDAFGIVVIVVSVASAVVAVVLFMRASRIYEQIGRGGTMGLDLSDEEWRRSVIQEEVRQALADQAGRRNAADRAPARDTG